VGAVRATEALDLLPFRVVEDEDAVVGIVAMHPFLEDGWDRDPEGNATGRALGWGEHGC
jgi:hypothetical protein